MCCAIIGCLCAGKSREAEVKRINKELANIRSKFKGIFTPFRGIVGLFCSIILMNLISHTGPCFFGHGFVANGCTAVQSTTAANFY